MSKPFVEVSFLVTEEDFINMELTKKKYSTPKENKIILRVLGFIAVLCGVGVYVFIGGNIWQSICWILLIVIGLFCLFYYDVINPTIVRKQAQKFYNFNKFDISSKTVKFYEDEKFEMISGNYKISVPKKYIYKTINGNNTIIIFFDKNNYCFIPKRVFSAEQLEKITDFTEYLYRNKK